MFTDAFKPKLINDVVYEVDAKIVSVSNAIDPRLLGANPSAEENEDCTDDKKESVIDLVFHNRLVKTTFTKKGFQTYLKVCRNYHCISRII